MTLPFDVPLEISSNMLWQEVQGEAVLLDLAGERYYSLNGVGTRVWTLLIRGLSAEEIYADILNEYDVEPEALRRDLVHLLDALETARLVRVVETTDHGVS